MSIKSEIEKGVRIRQRGVRINVGDQFWRGVQLVQVLGVDSTSVKYQVMSNGDTSTIERRDFVSKGVLRVPKVSETLGPFLDRVWSVVGTKSLPMKYRFDRAKSMITSKTPREDRLRIEKWMYALTMQKEPRR